MLAAFQAAATQGSTLSKLQSPSERHASSSAENGGQADPGGDDVTGVQTLVLDVRFPNGYEAAAKAVVAFGGACGGQEPFIGAGLDPDRRRTE